MTGRMIPNPVYVMTNKHPCLDVMIKKVKKKLQQEHAYALQKMRGQEFALKIPPPQNSGWTPQTIKHKLLYKQHSLYPPM